ncbi:MAG: hypothetical protein ACRC7N_07845 [Clostridium sp.]
MLIKQGIVKYIKDNFAIEIVVKDIKYRYIESSKIYMVPIYLLSKAIRCNFKSYAKNINSDFTNCKYEKVWIDEKCINFRINENVVRRNIEKKILKIKSEKKLVDEIIYMNFIEEKKFKRVFFSKIQGSIKDIYVNTQLVKQIDKYQLMDGVKVLSLKKHNMAPFLINNKKTRTHDILLFLLNVFNENIISKIYIISSLEDEVYQRQAIAVLKECGYNELKNIKFINIDINKLRKINDIYLKIKDISIDKEEKISFELIDRYIELYFDDENDKAINNMVELLYKITKIIEHKDIKDKLFIKLYCIIIKNTLELV